MRIVLERRFSQHERNTAAVWVLIRGDQEVVRVPVRLARPVDLLCSEEVLHPCLGSDERLGRSLCTRYKDDLFWCVTRRLDLLRNFTRRAWPRDAFLVTHANRGETIAMDAFVGEATLIAHPVLVHIGIKPRAVALGLALMVIEIDVAVFGAAGADGVRARQTPDATVEPEVTRGERAHRTNVGDVQDRKRTRLNSSHVAISYAVF